MVKNSLQRIRCFRLHVFVIFLLTVPATKGASIVYVTPLGSGDLSGSSWYNAITAQNFAQRLAVAPSGSQFWVAGGLYKPTYTTDRNASFTIPSGVQVYGGFVGTETALASRPVSRPGSTTLSGDIGTVGDNLDNSYHVVRFNNVTDQTVLDNVVVTAGYASGPSLNGSIPHNYGAGLYNNAQYSGNSSRPVIRDCYFINNSAVFHGGAICNSGVLQAEAVMTLVNCTFSTNTGYSGGAVYNEAGSTGRFRFQATNCTFKDNRAYHFGGGVSNSIRDASTNQATFTNCRFSNNRGGENGGAIANGNTSGSVLQVEVLNSLFSTNSCRYGGAGIDNNSTGSSISMQVVNSTFSRNTLTDGTAGAAIHNFSNQAKLMVKSVVQNCIIWGNSSGIYDEANASTRTTYSDVQDRPDTVSALTGNRSVDPLFLNAGGDDFRLDNRSPLLDAGDPASSSATVGSIDLAGNSRIIGSRVDMGAYESASQTTSGEMVTLATGAWNDAAIWSANRIPTSMDIIRLKHRVILPANYMAKARRLIYEPNIFLTWGEGAQLLLAQ